MSYSITLTDSVFQMTAENARKAKKTLKEEMPVYQHFNTFSEIMSELIWPVEMDEDENVVGIQFEGECLYEEEKIFSLLAPFVEPGSFLQILGERGSMWRWVFDGETCTRQNPTITWPG